MSNMPLSFENLQKFFLIQTLAFQVSASRKASVFFRYSGDLHVVSFYAETLVSDGRGDFLFPETHVFLDTLIEDDVSAIFDNSISFLNSLLSAPANPDALALTHEAAFNAAQMPLL